MKKVLVVLMAAVICNGSAAQTGVKGPVRFGAKSGVSAGNMNFNKGVPRPATPVDASWKAGVIAGLYMRVPIGAQLSIQPEYAFLQAPGENKTTGNKYALSYLSLPVLLRYQVNKLAFIAGPEFDLLLHSTRKTVSGTMNITHDTEERNFGAVVGVQYGFTKSLGLDLRYVHGLNHVGLGQRSNVIEFKYEIVQLAVTVQF